MSIRRALIRRAAAFGWVAFAFGAALLADFPPLALPSRELVQVGLLEVGPADGFINFGYGTSVEGSWMATLSTDPAREVLVYHRSAAGPWLPHSTIHRPGGSGSRNPSAVSIQDDTLVLLRNFYDGDDLFTRFYVYKRSGPSWTLVRNRTQDLRTGGFLGFRLAVDGDYLAVGVPTAFNSLGRVWVFERDLGGRDNWGLATTLEETGETGLVDFGASLALVGNELFVGSPRGNGNSGSVFHYRRSAGGEWEQITKIIPPQSEPSQEIGWALVANRTVLAVRAGALASSTAEEKVLIFEREAGTDAWQHRKTLRAPSRPAAIKSFGWSLALDEGRLALTNNYENVGPHEGAGVLYLYDRDHPKPGEWGLVKRLRPRAPERFQSFGGSPEFASGQLLAKDGNKQHVPRVRGGVVVFQDPLIFRNDFENETAGWSRRVNVELVGPGLQGTETAMRLTVGEGGAVSKVSTRRPENESAFRAAFWIDPRGLVLANSEVEILRLHGGGRAHTVLTLSDGPTGYRVNIFSAENGAPLVLLGGANLEARENQVQLDWERAFGQNEADGLVRLYVGGVVRSETEGLRNSRYRVTNVSVGLPSGSTGSGAGSFLVDGFVCSR